MSAGDVPMVGARGARGKRPPRTSPGGSITLRHGAVLLQNLSHEEARVLTAEFGTDGGATKAGPGLVLDVAQNGAKQLLDGILVAFPRLGGQAAGSFATALRVEAVRAKYANVMIRPKVPLLRTLGHIANAADAGRRLTTELVHEAIQVAISSLSVETPCASGAFDDGASDAKEKADAQKKEKTDTKAKSKADAQGKKDKADVRMKEKDDAQAKDVDWWAQWMPAQKADAQALEKADPQANEKADPKVEEKVDAQAEVKGDSQEKEKADAQVEEKAEAQAKEEADAHAKEEVDPQAK